MAAAAKPVITEAEYLAYDLAHEARCEFVNGEIIAMAGASERHELLVMNLGRVIGNCLRGRTCRVYGSNLRIKTDDTGMYAYPDATVVCGASRVLGTNPVTLTNPHVVFEVLSETTEKYDRGAKFAHYRHLRSLKAYVLVASDERRVEVYARNDNNTWTMAEAVGTGEVGIAAIDVAFELTTLYEGFDAIGESVVVDHNDTPVA